MPHELSRNARGEVVISGIRKRPVTVERVDVGTTNIVGDGQGDLRVHGGPEKAVYCYSADHYAGWESTYGYSGPDGFARFGENLTVSGIIEDDVCIGDIWQWGDVELQVSQPRWPCYKLALHADEPRIVTWFVAEARSGWYFRVLKTGTAPTSGEIQVVRRDALGISVSDAFRANRDRNIEPELWKRVCAHPLLAEQWKK